MIISATKNLAIGIGMIVSATDRINSQRNAAIRNDLTSVTKCFGMFHFDSFTPVHHSSFLKTELAAGDKVQLAPALLVSAGQFFPYTQAYKQPPEIAVILSG
jgi:hypothetical protein